MPLYGCKYKHFLQKYQIISTISDNITQMIPTIAHQMIPFVALLMIPAFNAQEHKVWMVWGFESSKKDSIASMESI